MEDQLAAYLEMLDYNDSVNDINKVAANINMS